MTLNFRKLSLKQCTDVFAKIIDERNAKIIDEKSFFFNKIKFQGGEMQIWETRGDKVYLGNLEYFILIEPLNLQNKQYVSCRRLGNAIMGGSNIGQTDIVSD